MRLDKTHEIFWVSFLDSSSSVSVSKYELAMIALFPGRIPVSWVLLKPPHDLLKIPGNRGSICTIRKSDGATYGSKNQNLELRATCFQPIRSKNCPRTL